MGILSGLQMIIGAILDGIVALLCAILPKSPFKSYQHLFSEFEYLEYVNYFLPISEMVAVMQTWLLCVALWYVWNMVRDIMSWVSGYGGGSVTVPKIGG